MSIPPKLIAGASTSARRDLLRGFFRDVVIPQRSKLVGYRALTDQSAQVDSDGYLGQIIASIVTGVPGTLRRGKSGSHKGDLVDGTEVKSTYRAEQKNGKEDAHVNFGQISRDRMAEFLDRDRCIIVCYGYDQAGRFKVEVLGLELRHAHLRAAIRAFLDRSEMARPQLQPRLYPDGRRDVLQELPGHLKALGARLLARVVDVAGHAVVDKWAPRKGLPLGEVLDLAPGTRSSTAARKPPSSSAKHFFDTCMVQHRRALAPYCSLTASSQNVGFGNLAQHLVSLVTGMRGTGSGARGADLIDGSEIKLAMGLRGDSLGTEDVPRLNLGNSVPKMLAWPGLYPVRIVCPSNRLMAKVLRADVAMFRAQVRDYFSKGSRFSTSANMQYHVTEDFESDVFTGRDSRGGPRVLPCERLFLAKE